MPKNTKLEVIKTSTPAVMEPWEQQLVNDAKDLRATESVGLPRITHSGGILQIDGKKIENNRVTVVVVETARSKDWYEHEYVQGQSATPGCYAFGNSDKGLVPHSSAPKKQAPSCDSCPHNVFGTAEKGKGKRCKDNARLLVILRSDVERLGADADAVKKAEVRTISIPPASLRNWSNYLNSLVDLAPHGSVHEVFTEIIPEGRTTGAYTLTFHFLGLVPPKGMPAMMQRKVGAFDALTRPYPVIEAEEAPKTIKGQKGKR